MSENGLGLKYAMPYVRHEREVVKLAISNNAQAVFFASPICLTMADDTKGDGGIDPDMLTFVDEVHRLIPYSLCVSLSTNMCVL